MLLAVVLFASTFLCGCRDAGPEIEEEERVTVQEFGEVYTAGEKDSLEDLTSRAEVVVIDFNALWCGPCKMLAPHLDKMADDYPSVFFVSADADKCKGLVESVGDVFSLPCVVVYFRGLRVGRVVGFNPSGVRKEIESAVEEQR